MKPFLTVFSLLVSTNFQLLQAQPFYDGMQPGMQPLMQPGMPDPMDPMMNSPRKKTDIRNKNVNIIVNMDPKQVAAELWKVISDHLGNVTPQDAVRTMNQIETVISPVLMPSRRGGTIPAAQVAEDLENITRRLLLNENPNIDPMKMELIVKDVTTDLLTSLENIWTGVDTGVPNSKDDDSAKADQDDYVDLRVKIKKSDLSAVILNM